MLRIASIVLMATCAMPIWSQHASARPITDERLLAMLPERVTIERRIDGDLDGDGHVDAAFVFRSDGSRALSVVLCCRDAAGSGHRRVGELKLDPDRPSTVKLSIRKGVLIFEERLGGKRITEATYRFRYDAERKKMRAIGIDAHRYTRDDSDVAIKISWNLLTGAYVLDWSEPNVNGAGDKAMIDLPTERHRVGVEPAWWLHDMPSADSLIDSELNLEEDRD